MTFSYWLAGAAVAMAAAGSTAAAQDVSVFAAASLQNALDVVAEDWADAGGAPVVTSYGASSAMARQVEQGAPADIFFSADVDWMAYLAERGLIDEASRRDLLGNRLVLIAADPEAEPVEVGPDLDLAGMLGEERLAMAEVEAVPAGRYGKAALEHLGLWDGVADQLAEAENVRATLRLVAIGEAPFGIVYETDAAAEPGVGIVGTFPAESHPAIVYPVALTAESDNANAAEFLAYLDSEAAHEVFESHGFTVLD